MLCWCTWVVQVQTRTLDKHVLPRSFGVGGGVGFGCGYGMLLVYLRYNLGRGEPCANQVLSTHLVLVLV